MLRVGKHLWVVTSTGIICIYLPASMAIVKVHSTTGALHAALQGRALDLLPLACQLQQSVVPMTSGNRSVQAVRA